MVTLIQS